MNVVYTSNLSSILHDSTLVVDACVIIDATKNPDFYTFMKDLVEKYGVTLISVPAVKHEVFGAADSRQEYEKLDKAIKDLEIIFLPPSIENKFEDEGIEFNIAIRRSKFVNKPSFVDRLILAVPLLYRKSKEKIFVITSNHKDVPFDFFDREAFIVKDNGREFSEVGIYRLNNENFNRICQRI